MKSLLTIGLLVLLGAGCTPATVSSLTSQEAAAQATLDTGSTITLRPTVLGVGGSIVEWLGGEAEDRVVTIEEWTPGESASVSWRVTSKVETVASVEARRAYDEQYARSPVGVEIPVAPKTVYEEQVRSGSVSTASLNDGVTMLLPELWSEGDMGASDGTLIWLSRKQYDELANTRATTLSLGLFDESLQSIEDTKSKIKSLLGSISQILPLFKGEPEGVTGESEETSESLLTLTASPSWGSYSLVLNAKRTTVRTIEAQNKFASLTILANPDNPLILELRLTPLARGTLNLLSTDALLEGLGGYEVIEIQK